MKKVILSIFALTMLILPSSAATKWAAVDRVAPVGKIIVEKSSLPDQLQFELVESDQRKCDDTQGKGGAVIRRGRS